VARCGLLLHMYRRCVICVSVCGDDREPHSTSTAELSEMPSGKGRLALALQGTTCTCNHIGVHWHHLANTMIYLCSGLGAGCHCRYCNNYNVRATYCRETVCGHKLTSQIRPNTRPNASLRTLVYTHIPLVLLPVSE